MTGSDGMQFEALIALLETASPHGFRVARRARLPDASDGALREFDVLLAKDGPHGPVYIGIECKDLSRKVDRPKIEAYVTKCKDTGIGQMVFASASGFTVGAIRKAQRHGVVLLELQRDGTITFPAWFLPRVFKYHETAWKLRKARFLPSRSTGIGEQTIHEADLNDPVVSLPSGPVSVATLISLWLDKRKEQVADLPSLVPLTSGRIDFDPPARLPESWDSEGRDFIGLLFQIAVKITNGSAGLSVSKLREVGGADMGIAFVSEPFELANGFFESILAVVTDQDGSRRVAAEWRKLATNA